MFCFLLKKRQPFSKACTLGKSWLMFPKAWITLKLWKAQLKLCVYFSPDNFFFLKSNSVIHVEGEDETFPYSLTWTRAWHQTKRTLPLYDKEQKKDLLVLLHECLCDVLKRMEWDGEVCCKFSISCGVFPCRWHLLFTWTVWNQIKGW